MEESGIIKNDIEEESSRSPDNSKGNKKNEGNTSAEDPALNTFRATKHFYGAITWLVCVLLMFACFLETKIWAMAALMPVLLIISAGFFRDAKYTSVDFEDSKMLIKDYSSFTGIKSVVNVSNIKAIEVDAEKKKDEIIHSLILITNNGNVEVPDIDNKSGLIEKIKSLNPKVKVNRV